MRFDKTHNTRDGTAQVSFPKDLIQIGTTVVYSIIGNHRDDRIGIFVYFCDTCLQLYCSFRQKVFFF